MTCPRSQGWGAAEPTLTAHSFLFYEKHRLWITEMPPRNRKANGGKYQAPTLARGAALWISQPFWCLSNQSLWVATPCPIGAHRERAMPQTPPPSAQLCPETLSSHPRCSGFQQNKNLIHSFQSYRKLKSFIFLLLKRKKKKKSNQKKKKEQDFMSQKSSESVSFHTAPNIVHGKGCGMNPKEKEENEMLYNKTYTLINQSPEPWIQLRIYHRQEKMPQSFA